MHIMRQLNTSHISALLKFLYIPSLIIAFALVNPYQAGAQVLTFVDTVFDNANGVDGLNQARGVFVSPDGAHVYVAGNADDALAVFSRNSSTGGLTFVEFQQDGMNGVDGLKGAHQPTVSPGGNYVFVAAFDGDAFAVFSRNKSTGALTFTEVFKDGVNGVDGLNGAARIAISPNGAHVYVTGIHDDAVAVFSSSEIVVNLSRIETQSIIPGKTLSFQLNATLTN